MTVTISESTGVIPQNIPDELAPIFEELRHTPFACSAIDEVPGHRVNSTLYATLDTPLPDGSTSVVVKYTKGWDAPWLGISISAARCVTERNVLSQQLCPVVHDSNFTVRPPRLLHFIPQHSTQVIERLENTSTLPEYLRFSAGKAVTAQFSTSLGHALGKWLSAFHAQNSAENGAKPALQQAKIPDHDLYVNLYLGTVETHIKMSPKLFEGKEEALRSKVVEGLKKDIKGRMGLIHGDLGARHILIHEEAPIPGQATLLTPIDWETVHFGCQNQDLGQIVGELSLVNQFDQVAASCQVLQGLSDGYRSLTDESVFHVAFYAGLHILMILLTDGEPNIPKQDRMVGFALDCILKGAEQDRQWLELSPLKDLMGRAS